MRYARYKDYRLNPRQPIDLLDVIAARLSNERFTFTEETALEDVWRSGEELRLREDSRFWEIEAVGHFQLAAHKLANDDLTDRLWQGVWDGKDVVSELKRLDELEPDAFHVFCPVDPRFVEHDARLILAACPNVPIPEQTKIILDTTAEELLAAHRQSGALLTTSQLHELLAKLKPDLVLEAIEILEGWLCSREEWAEIARGLWLPSDLVPSLDEPRIFRVLRIAQTETGLALTQECEVSEVDKPSPTDSRCIIRLHDPPVEREANAAVAWIHTLRAIHLRSCYLPVPTEARYRYPRFVGHNNAQPIVVKALAFDTGHEGHIWLDRIHHRFFGEMLSEIIEWEEAGRKLHIHWHPEAVSIRLGEIDEEVQREEERHIDAEALHELRNGRGESYRQTLAGILRDQENGLSFREVYEEACSRQQHLPSKGTIRAVLGQSPEFSHANGLWSWRDTPNGARSLRQQIIIGEASLESGKPLQTLDDLASAISDTLHKLISI